MSVLSGDTITSYLREGVPIVSPFSKRNVAFGMSYGASHAGYDIRIRETMVITKGMFRLSSSVEEFNMPNDVIGFVHDKSTWARQGLSLFNTVIEPGWKGFLTLELVNHGETLFLKSGMPIAQIIFHYVDQYVSGYEGKYQNQAAIPVPALHEAASCKRECEGPNIPCSPYCS